MSNFPLDKFEQIIERKLKNTEQKNNTLFGLDAGKTQDNDNNNVIMIIIIMNPLKMFPHIKLFCR